MLVLLLRVVETPRGPGRMAEMTAAAHMPASICAMKVLTARSGVRTFMMSKPSVTCDLESVQVRVLAVKTETNSWIKEATTDSKESPDIDT